MAEQLGVDQLGRDRAAVDADDRTVRAPALGVDRTRDHLLARAGLAEDEHRCVGARHLLDALHHVAQAGGRADHGVADVLPFEAREQRLAIGFERFAHARELVHAAIVLEGHAQRLEQRLRRFDVLAAETAPAAREQQEHAPGLAVDRQSSHDRRALEAGR